MSPKRVRPSANLGGPENGGIILLRVGIEERSEAKQNEI